MKQNTVVLRILVIVLCGAFGLSAAASDSPDLGVVYRIKQEALQRSEVMQHLFRMTDVNGPRLTNSPGFDAAAADIVAQAEEWGLENVALEEWGPFGRGWSASYFSAHMIEPQYSPIIGVPLAWTPGTDGVVEGVPILAPTPASLYSRDADIDEVSRDLDAYIERWRGQLAGAIVLMRRPRHLSERTQPDARRFSAEDLRQRAQAPEPTEPISIDPQHPEVPEDAYDRVRYEAQMPREMRNERRERRRKLRDRLNAFLVAEGVRLAIHPSFAGDGGTIFPPRVSSHATDATDPPPSIAITPEHYNRLARLLEAGIKPLLEVEIRARFHDEDLNAVNVVAEIPGTVKKDELVIIGAHLDDVVYATGATDNAAGCAVMMEVMRILSTLDLPMERTVRMVLWSGEEEGLLGSRAYVKQHFGDPESGTMTPENAKVSAYYNLDNGTGKIRGIYLQENDLVRPIFQAWLSPFHDLGATATSIRNTGGTDHLSFDAVGIPGFQFIQDPIEYNSRTHHSNMDVYDRVQASDLMQAAAVVASFVYHTANRPEMLPRKPQRVGQ